MSFEKTGLVILKSLGFENFRKPKQTEKGWLNYDKDAEKDGIKYAIEIKKTSEGGKYTIHLSQLRAMASQFKDENRKPLLLLVDESQLESEILDYYLFELKGISFGSFNME